MKAAPIRKTVRAGSLRIDVREYGDGRYGFDYIPPQGERQKVRLLELDAAIERAHQMLSEGRAGKLNLLGYDPKEIEEFLRFQAKKTKGAQVPELVPAFLRVLHRKGVTEYHYNDTKVVLERFAKAFPVNIIDLSRSSVEKWLDDYGMKEREGKVVRIGPKRWNALRAHIVALIRFARSDNFVGPDRTPSEQIAKRKTTTKKETFDVEKTKQLLRSFNPEDEWLPCVVLGLFAHVRPEESCPNPNLKRPKPPLMWEHFRWDKKVIRMPKEVSKVGRARLIPLLDVTIDLLRPWWSAKGPVAPRLWIGNQIRRWVKVSGVQWGDDILRHTSASHRLAITQDIAALSLEMGSSVKMIHDHYLDLKFEDDARAYYAIRAAKLWPGWNFKELSAA